MTEIPARVTDPDRLGAIAETPMPSLRLDGLDKDAMQNVMLSMQAMMQAQIRRFDAAGAVVILFDSTGMAVTAVERPARGGVTDDYIRGMFLQLAGVDEPAPKPKRKDRRR